MLLVVVTKSCHGVMLSNPNRALGIESRDIVTRTLATRWSTSSTKKKPFLFFYHTHQTVSWILQDRMIKTIDVTSLLRVYMQDKNINRNSSFMTISFRLMTNKSKVCPIRSQRFCWWNFPLNVHGDPWAMNTHASPSDSNIVLCHQGILT